MGVMTKEGLTVEQLIARYPEQTNLLMWIDGLDDLDDEQWVALAPLDVDDVLAVIEHWSDVQKKDRDDFWQNWTTQQELDAKHDQLEGWCMSVKVLVLLHGDLLDDDHVPALPYYDASELNMEGVEPFNCEIQTFGSLALLAGYSWLDIMDMITS